jgi:hypothetical protein
MTIGQCPPIRAHGLRQKASLRALRMPVQVRTTLKEVMWSGKVEIDSNF